MRCKSVAASLLAALQSLGHAVAIVSGILWCAGATGAQPLPAYHVTDLTAVIAPTGSVVPADINNLDQIVGQVLTTNARGFLYSGGTTTLLDPLADSMYDASAATAINSLGQIVGTSDVLGIPKSAYWSTAGAQPQLLATGGGPDANVYANAINDQTTIAGFFTGSGSGNVKSWTAVKWQPDPGHPDRFQFTKLDTPVVPPAGVPAGGFGINAAGQIIGSGAVDPSSPVQGPLRWSPTDQVTPLDTLVEAFVFRYDALAINDASVAVGQYVTTFGVPHALLWNADGSLVPLAEPSGFSETSALDINNAGLIIGRGVGPSGSPSALLNVAEHWVNLNARLVNGDGWRLESAVAINQRGAIVGVGKLNGVERAFLLDPVALLPGDYNGDHVVNAADYTVWRNNLRAADESALLGSGDGMHGVDQADFELWKQNFGIVGPGAGSFVGAGVPEPATVVLLIAAATLLMCGRMRGGPAFVLVRR